MNDSAHQHIARGCRDGLEALDHILEHQPDHVHDTLAAATRCMARVRDSLIAAQRREGRRYDELLGHVNPLMSVLVAAEFPLVGVRWDRVKQARDQYEEVIGRLDAGR